LKGLGLLVELGRYLLLNLLGEDIKAKILEFLFLPDLIFIEPLFSELKNDFSDLILI
jgi:hypothetical protein